MTLPLPLSLPLSRTLRALIVLLGTTLALILLVSLDARVAFAETNGTGTDNGETGDDGSNGDDDGDPPPRPADPCPVGKHSQTGLPPCADIPLGSQGTGGTGGVGSTGVEQCPAGKYRSVAASTFCVDIPLGSRGTGGSNGLGSKAVELCPVGTFRSDTATTACAPIPAGREGTGGSGEVGSTGTRACPVGRFRSVGPSVVPSTACAAIPLGSEGRGGASDGTGSTGTALCDRGTFRGDPATTACRPARVGFVVPDPGSRTETPCPTATRTGLAVCPEATTAPTPAPERDAPETGDGSLSPQGEECSPGTWSVTGTSRGGSSCTPASPGTFVASPGATAEEPCPAGTFSDGFGATECTPAPVGTFVAEVGAMDPVPCPGAMETGMTVCPEAEVAALPTEQLADPDGRTSVWWWIGGLTLVLAAGGAGFVLVQRRTGALDATVTVASAGAATLTDLTGIDTTSSDLRAVDPGWAPDPAASSGVPDVLEWDEALDGVLDDEQDPPPNPA